MRVKNNFYGRYDLFRYSIIVPLINNTNPYSTINEFCYNASLKSYEFNGKLYKFKPRTIKDWYYKFINSGFDELNNHKRGDKSKFRKIKDDTVVDRIIELGGTWQGTVHGATKCWTGLSMHIQAKKTQQAFLGPFREL